jgi:hypothetical protein
MEEQLDQARELIKQKRYREARELLRTIDHPRPHDWLNSIDHFAPDDEQSVVEPPEYPDYTPNPEKPKRKPKRGAFATEDFTVKAILTLAAYWALWFAGIGLNLYFLSQARQQQRDTGERPKGIGCLWTLLFVHLILPLGLIVLIVLLALFLPQRVS